MKRTSLDSRRIALLNMRSKSKRSVSLVILVAFLTFVLFVSNFLIVSLDRGIDSLSDRLGADIIVVPNGYDAEVQGSILRGEPSNFFMNEDNLGRIRMLDGVKRATPQLFVATLSASCCSFPVQIVGIDFESDFVVAPWLKNEVKLPLGPGEVLVGHSITGNKDELVKFFNHEYMVKGKLSKTGMGFDNTVFMDIKEAEKLAEANADVIGIKDNFNSGMISSVLVGVEDGAEVNDVQNAIRREFKGEDVFPILSLSMMNEVGSYANNIKRYLYFLIIVLWLMIFLTIALMYSIIIKERKVEFASFRVIGCKKKDILKIMINEILAINFSGAVIGSTIGLVFSVLFGNWFKTSFNTPFLAPRAGELTILFVTIIFFGTIVGPIASAISLRKINKEELGLLINDK